MLAMMQICDSAFPSGAFALSNGLETLVQQDKLTTADGFETYLHDWCALLAYREIGIMVAATRLGIEIGQNVAGAGSDSSDGWRRVIELDATAAAMNVCSEVRKGAVRMCSSVRKVTGTYGSFDLLQQYGRYIDHGVCRGTHPIAVGLFAASIGVDATQAARMYGYSLLSALTLCAVKSIPLKQSDGQRILYDRRADIVAAVDQAAKVDMDMLGVSGPLMEIASMQHETLYTRLFMS